MKYLALILALLLTQPSLADERSPIAYSKTAIRIQPAIPVAGPATKRALKRFHVEVRPLRYLTQQDFLTHRSFVSYEGMLILIDPPSRQTLNTSSLFGRVDALFVKEDGFISKIVPNVSLADLTQPIDSEVPIHAFVFLQAGMAKIADVQPGDRVENELFSKPTAIEGAPTTGYPASPVPLSSPAAAAPAAALPSPASPTATLRK